MKRHAEVSPEDKANLVQSISKKITAPEKSHCHD
jgi:cation transport ATPase